jgi:predicted ArsR family transcriptional regulator
MGRKRSDGGEYVDSFGLGAVLDVFDRVDGPVVTSGDVADELGCSRETARRKLAELHEQGSVERRTTAGRVVWWLADPGAPRETRETSAAPLRQLVGGLDGDESDRVRERARAFRESVDEEIAETHARRANANGDE